MFYFKNMVSNCVRGVTLGRLLSNFMFRNVSLSPSKSSEIFKSKYGHLVRSSACVHTCSEASPRLFNLRLLCFDHRVNFHFQSDVQRQLKTSSAFCSPKILIKISKSKHTDHRKNGTVSEEKHDRYQSQFQDAKTKFSEKIVELKENIITVPNALCVLRMAVTPFLGYLVLKEFYMISFGLFIFAGFTDLIDGYIARTFPSQQSMIGSFLDPAADKLLIATLFLTLTANGLIPVPLTSLIIFRDVCLMGAGFYIRYVSLPPPKTFFRYFDASFATARLSPTGISKVNTLFQLSLVGTSLVAPIFGFVDHLALQVFWFVTAFTTVLSAGSYLYCKDTYKLLTMKNRTKKYFHSKDS